MARDIYGLPATGGDPRVNKIRQQAIARLSQISRDKEVKQNKKNEELKFLKFLESKNALNPAQKLRLEYLLL